MIKLLEVIGLPSLQYHLDNKLTLSECVYRYSSDSFIQLFAEARQAWSEGKIQLNKADECLLEDTDIGEYGVYEGVRIPLDVPFAYQADVKPGMTITGLDNTRFRVLAVSDEVIRLSPTNASGEIATFPNDFKGATGVDDFWDYFVLDKISEAKYRGEDVALGKPKRGGPKKFYVYTKNSKGNVVKVNFGGTTGLNVKIDQPGARSSFAARHQCDKKKDKTKPGYWACNIGRYWKSLGGSKNFSGYW